MKHGRLTFFFSLMLTVLALSGQAAHADTIGKVQEGEASYYADSLDGNKTASGAIYDKDAMTAAHRDLPFGTRVKVTYLETGKTVEVTINDRGPRAKDRIIDLSGAAARKLGMIDDGHGKVRLEVIAP
jgi:rare lipoprotein A